MDFHHDFFLGFLTDIFTLDVRGILTLFLYYSSTITQNIN